MKHERVMVLHPLESYPAFDEWIDEHFPKYKKYFASLRSGNYDPRVKYFPDANTEYMLIGTREYKGSQLFLIKRYKKVFIIDANGIMRESEIATTVMIEELPIMYFNDEDTYNRYISTYKQCRGQRADSIEEKQAKELQWRMLNEMLMNKTPSEPCTIANQKSAIAMYDHITRRNEDIVF